MKAGAIIAKYFNTAGDPEGYERKSPGEFVAELKALSPEEKKELARLAAAEMGVEVTA